RTAAAGPVPVAGVVALAFPLHPPGRPERSRAGELAAVGVPLLVVQGERDPFGRPAEFPGGVDVRVVPGADHTLAGAGRGAVGWGELCRWVGDWLLATR
ncbi:MAG: alpha/beta family hydrolase, partial [Actinomycetota bacterium]